MSQVRNKESLVVGKKVGFVGGGNMASAIGKGLIRKSVLKNTQVYVSSPSKETLDSWKEYDVTTTHVNKEVINDCDIIILAFKPYQLQIALRDCTTASSKLFVSILVGVKSDTIMEMLQKNVDTHSRLIRAMPNVAMFTGEGCCVISPHKSATAKDIKMVKYLFSSLGNCQEISEHLMSPVAALIGSGPAYIFVVIEALADGAVKHGLPRDLALSLAAQTVLGSSKMVLDSKMHPGQLKDSVCSPGGTTICAIHELEKGNLRATFMNAIQAAVEKAEKIANSS